MAAFVLKQLALRVTLGGYFHKAKHYLCPHNVNVGKTFTKTTNLN